MLRYLAEEDFDNRILRAFRRTEHALDCVRVQDVGLSGEDDDAVLQFAAESARVVLTRDVSTMPEAAYRRVTQLLPMPGLIVVSNRLALGRVIDELLFIARDSEANEWHGQVLYLPL
jgi:hypothetical protein